MELLSNSSIIRGIGIDADALKSRIEKDALMSLLEEQYGKAGCGCWESMSVSDIIDDILKCGAVYHLAELFWLGDQSDRLTYGWAWGTSYLYFSAQMPWEFGDGDPQSLEDVQQIIIRAVQRLCPSMTSKEIEGRTCELHLAEPD